MSPQPTYASEGVIYVSQYKNCKFESSPSIVPYRAI